MSAPTIVAAAPFPEVRKLALKLGIDFGPEVGRERSSAQVAVRYAPDKLVGRQVLAVVSFVPRQIGPFWSEVLVLGLPDTDGAIVLIAPDAPIPNGARLA